MHSALAGAEPGAGCRGWATIPDLEDRARRAFGELYGWYRDHADALYPINRDAASMPSSARLASDARTRFLADAILAGDVAGRSDHEGRLARAVARHLVAFMTWHSFAVGQGLDDLDIVATSVRLLLAVS